MLTVTQDTQYPIESKWDETKIVKAESKTKYPESSPNPMGSIKCWGRRVAWPRSAHIQHGFRQERRATKYRNFADDYEVSCPRNCRDVPLRSTVVFLALSLMCVLDLAYTVAPATCEWNAKNRMPVAHAFSNHRFKSIKQSPIFSSKKKSSDNRNTLRKQARSFGFVPNELETIVVGRHSTTRFVANGQSNNEESSLTPRFSYSIRDCQYRELKQVAALVVNSFYDKKKTNVVTRNLYQLAELNRLQQNYAYPESRSVHRMFVVEATPLDFKADDGSLPDCAIVGFCDVDARPCETKLKLPRPYLSDLAVDPDHRRQGLARELVEKSERFVLGLNESNSNGESSQSSSASYNELWIRVAEDNVAAIGLYQGRLGYVRTPWSVVAESSLPVDTQTQIAAKEQTKKEGEPDIWTLRKDLPRARNCSSDDASDGQANYMI